MQTEQIEPRRVGRVGGHHDRDDPFAPFGVGRPTTATSLTPGQVRSASATSPGTTLKPPVLITSSARPCTTSPEGSTGPGRRSGTTRPGRRSAVGGRPPVHCTTGEQHRPPEPYAIPLLSSVLRPRRGSPPAPRPGRSRRTRSRRRSRSCRTSSPPGPRGPRGVQQVGWPAAPPSTDRERSQRCRDRIDSYPRSSHDGGAASAPPTRARTRSGDRPGVGASATTGSVPPTSERTSTWIPATCVTGRQHSHRSPGRAPSRASEARAECSSAAALSSTPFGAPVDPEVPMITAVLSATLFFCPNGRW